MKTGCISVLALTLISCEGPSSTSLPATSEVRRRQEVVVGSELSSNFQEVKRVGEYLTYQGPAREGCVSYGHYSSQSGFNIKLEGSIELEAHLTPDTYEVCNKRDWKNKCVGWDTHFREHQFQIDMLGYANGDLFQQTLPIKNYQTIENRVFRFGPLNFGGHQKVEKVEIRVCDIVSREIDITVRRVNFDWVWSELCENQYVCTDLGDLQRFITETRASIEPAMRAALVANGQYLRLKQAQNDLACLIQSVDNALLYPEIANQLKESFQQQFDKPFVAGEAVCGGSLPKQHVLTEFCPPSISSDICDLQRVHFSNIQLLKAKLRLISLYRQSRSLTPEIGAEMTSLEDSIQSSLELLK